MVDFLYGAPKRVNFLKCRWFCSPLKNFLRAPMPSAYCCCAQCHDPQRHTVTISQQRAVSAAPVCAHAELAGAALNYDLLQPSLRAMTQEWTVSDRCFVGAQSNDLWQSALTTRFCAAFVVIWNTRGRQDHVIILLFSDNSKSANNTILRKAALKLCTHRHQWLHP